MKNHTVLYSNVLNRIKILFSERRIIDDFNHRLFVQRTSWWERLDFEQVLWKLGVSLKKLGISNDLWAILFVTATFDVAVVIPQFNGTFIRGILGILLVCFIPGYAVNSLVLGKTYCLLERVAIGFGFSAIITCITVLALNFSWGITEESLIIVLSFLTYLAVFFSFSNVASRIKTMFNNKNKLWKKATVHGPADL